MSVQEVGTFIVGTNRLSLSKQSTCLEDFGQRSSCPTLPQKMLHFASFILTLRWSEILSISPCSLSRLDSPAFFCFSNIGTRSVLPAHSATQFWTKWRQQIMKNYWNLFSTVVHCPRSLPLHKSKDSILYKATRMYCYSLYRARLKLLNQWC